MHIFATVLFPSSPVQSWKKQIPYVSDSSIEEKEKGKTYLIAHSFSGALKKKDERHFAHFPLCQCHAVLWAISPCGFNKPRNQLTSSQMGLLEKDS